MSYQTKNYYECHITMLAKPDDVQYPTEYIKWKFSAIDGDPSLGDGVKCYATRHYNARRSLEEVIAEVQDAAMYLRKLNINVLREKVELVVYDTKAKTVIV